MKTVAKLTSAIAAAGLVLSPVAVQAGTRAGDSPVAVDVSRGTEGVVEGSEMKFSLAWLILLLAAIAAVIAAGAGGDGRTRG